MEDMKFYQGKKVLITGHTGFKGSWMCKVLLMLGADVTGYALEAPTDPGLFNILDLSKEMKSIVGDIRDLGHLKQVFYELKPEIVIHMAAQPLVRESYTNPVYTYDVNVMGTVNILECIRLTNSVKSFVNVTTDKVYLNREQEEIGYKEDEELNGFDPYSNSKSCSELVTSSYKKSFFQDKRVAISTARAGNVIGGGDFAKDRIIPDCIRAALEKRTIIVRNPYSTRPYQHVLEPVIAYLMIAANQYQDKSYAGNYNVGPNDEDCWNTGDLSTLFCKTWSKLTGDDISWEKIDLDGPHEATFLKLDSSKLKNVFEWHPVWNINEAMDKILEWHIAYNKGDNINRIMENQITEYLSRR